MTSYQVKIHDSNELNELPHFKDYFDYKNNQNLEQKNNKDSKPTFNVHEAQCFEKNDDVISSQRFGQNWLKKLIYWDKRITTLAVVQQQNKLKFRCPKYNR